MTSQPAYTDEDVQTLAAFICDDTSGGHAYGPQMWDEVPKDNRLQLLDDARAILDAVAPAIAARALREAAQALAHDRAGFRDWKDPRAAVRWVEIGLHGRADEIDPKEPKP